MANIYTFIQFNIQIQESDVFFKALCQSRSLPGLFILTCVLGKPGADADLQGFAGRLQDGHVSRTLDKQDLPGAAAAQEAPVLLLQFQLQSENHIDKSFMLQRGSGFSLILLSWDNYEIFFIVCVAKVFVIVDLTPG